MQNEQSTTLTKIIEVSLKEFSLKGFRGTSLREIVKKAGVMKCTPIIGHFN